MLKNNLYLLVFCCLLLSPQIVLSQSVAGADNNKITPADVYVEVQKVEQYVNQIGLFMGVGQPDKLGVVISNASPHDVYFQAMVLVIKSNRLSYEILRRHRDDPPLPGREIRPVEVKKMVLKALVSLTEVSNELGIKIIIKSTDFDSEKTPSDVFIAISKVDRYLNSLLERRFSPAEVYRVVNLAIGYTSQQLAKYPGADRIPRIIAQEVNKSPVDVFYRLNNCLRLLSKIYEVKGYDILNLDISNIIEKNVNPSDVYDMASLIVARLDLLHKRNRLKRMPRDTFYPGRKFPSDVYQQAGILEKQLEILLSYMEGKDSN